MDRWWITEPSAILSHRICIADVYTSIADLSPMYRRCVADVNGTFLALVYIAECSPTARRCSAIYRRWYLASNIGRKCQCMHWNFPMPWRSMAITRVRRRSFAKPLVHGGAALAMPEFVHRESIERLKKPRGTVALLFGHVKDQTWHQTAIFENI